jgi:chromosome transmission fidelity protein 4
MAGWEKQVIFKSGHTGTITDLAWSPNGAYLATSATDGKVHIWQTKDQKIIATYPLHPNNS